MPRYTFLCRNKIKNIIHPMNKIYQILGVRIGLDKSRYQVNIFLISRRKHMLWVLIRGYSLEAPHRGTSNEYPQHMFSSRNKKNIHTFWLKKSALSRAMMSPSSLELLVRDLKPGYYRKLFTSSFNIFLKRCYKTVSDMSALSSLCYQSGHHQPGKYEDQLSANQSSR